MVRKNLSKTLFLKGAQCHKALWLTKHCPEKRSPLDFRKKALFEEGRQVGLLAQSLFPNGKAVDKVSDAIPMRLWWTKKWLQDKRHILYEATLQADLILIMVDIMRYSDQGLELIEVKMGTSPEKNHFLMDIVLQDYVCEKAGFKPAVLYLATINSDYQRGDEIDINSLFRLTDVTEKVRLLRPHVEQEIISMRESLRLPYPPDISIGTQCQSPYECEFKAYCWSHVARPTVLDLKGISWDKKFALYQKGIRTYSDVPPHHMFYDHPQIRLERDKVPILNKKELRRFLNKIEYPLSFLDFEAFQMAIPPFLGTHPYQQIPFQFSLHVQSTPHCPAQHHPYFVDPLEDPRPLIAQKLVDILPKKGAILVYDVGYEKTVLKEFSRLYPTHADFFEDAMCRLVDLMTPFYQHWVMTAEMQGGLSIKSVLPALLPHITYSSLDIQDGEMATRMYLHLACTDDPALQETYRQQLIDYCAMDTDAMVHILAYLYRLI